MSTPEQIAGQVMVPLTGEVVPLDAPTDVLAVAVDRIRELEGELRTAKRAVSDELLRRMDFAGAWTAHLPGWTVKGDGPGALEYDGEGLAKDLQDLVDNGEISQAAMDAAVEQVTEWRVRKAGINALLKLPNLGDVVRAHSAPSTKPRRVTVTPTGGGS